MDLTARVIGEGFPLLVIPGLCFTSTIFDPIIDHFKGEYKLVFVDLPGHGYNKNSFSAQIASEGIFDNFCRGVRSLLSAHGVEQFALMGFSLGATAAYCLASDPQITGISALISIEQSPQLLAEDGWPHAAFGNLTSEGLKKLLQGLDQDPDAFYEAVLSASLSDQPKISVALRNAIQAKSKQCDPKAVAALLLEATTQDWRGIDPVATSNLLIVHGLRSSVYPTDVGGWLCKNWKPKATLFFRDSGHMPFLDEPVIFAGAIKSFLDETCRSAL